MDLSGPEQPALLKIDLLFLHAFQSQQVFSIVENYIGFHRWIKPAEIRITHGVYGWEKRGTSSKMHLIPSLVQQRLRSFAKNSESFQSCRTPEFWKSFDLQIWF